MAILDAADVPYVGCGLETSVIAMDKVVAKQVTQSSGIPSTPWRWFYSSDLSKNHKKTMDSLKELQYPLFVKPAHLGSSIGISRVEKESELVNALEVAAHYDDKVIVEQGVANLIEVTLPIIGNDELTPALLESPLTKPEDFFDFDTKYMRGGKKGGGKSGGIKGAQGYSELLAKLPKELYDRAEKTGLDIYRALNCSGISRVDMLIDSKTEEVFFNEVNPLPGDLYAHNWRATGIAPVQLVAKLVDLAFSRFAHRQKVATTFSTNFLKQF
jgi:D-alanine-D-alanine ligase